MPHSIEMYLLDISGEFEQKIHACIQIKQPLSKRSAVATWQSTGVLGHPENLLTTDNGFNYTMG